MTLQKIQQEQFEWAKRNFSDHLDAQDPLTGMGEELGELCHAVLKMKQGIRTTEDHEAAFMDGIGDFGIYMAHFCSIQKIDFERVMAGITPIPNHNRQHQLLKLHLALASVYHAFMYDGDMEHALGAVAYRLKELCGMEYDFNGIMEETWAQVRERNWKKNPRDGRP